MMKSLLWFFNSLIYLLISQEQNLSPTMKRRCIAFLSAFSTAMLILSNLVFLGGIHVARIFWKRVFVQGKFPSMTLTLWVLCVSLFCWIVLLPLYINLFPTRIIIHVVFYLTVELNCRSSDILLQW